MFPISPSSKFFLYSKAVDMRKSFNGLQGIIYNNLDSNPLSGDIYLFINKRRDRIKLLVWDRTGFWLLYKRLERGRFQELINSENKTIELSYESLIMLLEGIDIYSVKRRKRYKITA